MDTSKPLQDDDKELLKQAMLKIQELEKKLDEKDGKPTKDPEESMDDPIITPDGKKVPIDWYIVILSLFDKSLQSWKSVAIYMVKMIGCQMDLREYTI